MVAERTISEPVSYPFNNFFWFIVVIFSIIRFHITGMLVITVGITIENEIFFFG